MNVGLVLGGGGVTGLAYHAGALAALEHDLGWDPRRADVVVGTSAGALVGAMLRRGVPASDLAALSVNAPTRATPESILLAANAASTFPPWSWRMFLRLPHLPGPALVMASMRRPWHIDPLGVVSSIVADGDVDLALHAELHAGALGASWPDAALWICAIEQQTQRRVVFGRDRFPSLTTAVMASCAIPGYFRPVIADGCRMVDGGVRSPTNADVLARKELDLAIVVSPMSGRGLGRIGLEALIRRHARRKLLREAALLRARGTRTLVLEPGHEVRRLAGMQFMSDEKATEIVSAAFLDVGEQLRTAVAETVVSGLGTRARRRPIAS